jgi:uncharacterized protein with PQ loop repeat
MLKFIFLLVLGITFFMGPRVIAEDGVPHDSSSASSAKSDACEGVNLGSGEGCSGEDFSGNIKKVVNILGFIAGVLGIIVGIISGLMFTVSAGDPQKTKKARDALLFAIVGIVVALMSFAIANFVVTQITESPSADSSAPVGD